METRLYLEILPQPDDTTCGQTCLHAVYRYFGDSISLQQVVSEVNHLEGGGTLAVHLACHALQRGYHATIYTYNLQIFDPTWFASSDINLVEKLELQMNYKNISKLQKASRAYIDFMKQGGQVKFEDLSGGLIRKYLNRSIPILLGLSATYLYKSAREFARGNKLIYNDIQGEATGHFVVLAGYDKDHRKVLIADPAMPNPISSQQQYEVEMDHLISAIMLGIITYDANLLIIEPEKENKRNHHANTHRCQ